MARYSFIFFFFYLSLCVLQSMVLAGSTYHVAEDGSDTSLTCSAISPCATITHALGRAMDNESVIEVHPGTYNGQVHLDRFFHRGIIVRSQVPYQAKLRHDDTVVTAYTNLGIVGGITLEGFDIAHSGEGAGALVVHIDGNGNNAVKNITLKNNILHDSYNNDILKINNACSNIVVRGNMFYNQHGSDEHIDINSVSDVTVEDNIFFNDFEGSGRTNQNNTSSYIVIKDSNGIGDIYLGSRKITVRRNIFLNWQGSSGATFLQAGEDGQVFYEAYDVLVENNLMLGNSSNVIRSAFGVKGCRDITFRNNSISGNLPSLAYAMRLNREGSNPANTNIQFYNNVWADQTGTMDDFSDTPFADTAFFTLLNNLYWNGGAAIPEDLRERINYTNDSTRLVADPILSPPVSITLPRWLENSEKFADGSGSIRAAFINLTKFAKPSAKSPLIDMANDTYAPDDDILGAVRSSPKTIGAFEAEVKKAISPIYLLLLD